MTAWLPVVGFEGYYEISDTGQVRSVERTIPHGTAWKTLRSKALKATAHPTGHLDVSLYRHHKRHHRGVHRLVLEAFVGPCPNGMEACHRDGEPSNNAVSNLYWGTRSDNVRDALRHGTHTWASRTECINGHVYVIGSYSMRSNGGRKCLICNRVYQAQYKAKTRGAA